MDNGKAKEIQEGSGKQRLKYYVTKGTFIICLLAVAFSALSIYSSWKMKKTATSIYEHPYTVSNSARMMRSRLLDMKQFIGIFLTDSFHSKAETEELLKGRYVLQQEAVEEIRKKYLGPEEDAVRLQEKMNELIAAQEKAVSYAVGHTDKEIFQYLNTYVYPKYDDVSKTLTTIVDFADQKVLQLEEESTVTEMMSILTAGLLSLIIICLTIHNNRRMDLRRTRDVADREKLFDLLSGNVDEVFMIYDLRKQQMEYVSDNCERVLHVSEEQLRTDRCALLPMVEEEDKDVLSKLFSSGIIRDQAERDFEMRLPDGGNSRWMNLKIYPVAVEDVVTRYIISISDQTEQMLVQQNLRDALVSAQNANEAKQNFMSRMSHEIRTPMNAIIGMTTIAAANLNDRKRVEDCLTKIVFSSRHLLSLINDVLDMSKIEEGKLTVRNEVFEFCQFMESITSIIYSQAQAKGLHFEVAIIDFTDEVLYGDCLRLNQILINLLSNAVKFTPEGGSIRLEIRKVHVKNKKIRLRFTVSDTGIGMTPEFMKRIYMPFEQADSSISHRYGGTGLGMSITKNLVSLLGGTIQVTSTVGEGSAFKVELPFELVKDEIQTAEEVSLENLKVLVVDDDKDCCVHTSLLLEKFGIEAKWVLSGAEAVHLVTSAHEQYQDYDVCFIDWQMPDIDGLETTRKIREHVGPDTLIIIISAYDWRSIERAAKDAGANAFITKPMFASSIYNTLLSVTGENRRIIKVKENSQKSYDFSGHRVLLAEDNELNREIAIELLKMVQLEVDAAENGRQAVDMVLNAVPGYYDLVLMDIQMPVMDGHEAARKIRSSGYPKSDSLPIIAMTANAFSEDVVAASEAGMNGHIPKPIDTELLYHLLDSLFQSRG
ncbi:MAG: response regulator [Blautia sp.]